MRLAVADEGDIGAGAADIQAHRVGRVGQPGDMAGADDAGRGAAQQHLRALGLAQGGAHHAAVRFGNHRRLGYPGPNQRVFQRAKVAGDPGLDITGDDRGDGALIFADDRPHVAGAHHGQFRRLFADDIAHLVFMVRVAIGVQQGHDDGVAAADRAHAVDGSQNAGFVDGGCLRPVGQDPAGYLKHLFLGHQRDRAARKQIVGIGHFEARHFQHIFEIGGREQAQIGALALDHRVHADCRAVGEIDDIGWRDPEARFQRRQSGHHLAARIVRRGQDLQAVYAVRRFVESAEIGECPADIDADPVPHGWKLSAIGRANCWPQVFSLSIEFRHVGNACV